MIAAIVDELAPELIKRNAIGYESASQLPIIAGASTSTVKTRIRILALWRQPGPRFFCGKRTVTDLIGGRSAANSALHIIAIGRLRTDAKQRNMSPCV